MSRFDRYTYICIPCRFASKYDGRCPSCSGNLRAMYDLVTPRKKDDEGWKKLELSVAARQSGLQLCTCDHCVPLGRIKKANFAKEKLTLSQLKARIRKMRTHHQGEVPRYYKKR